MNEDRKMLLKLYALEKSGLGCLDELESWIAPYTNMDVKELKAKYKEITARVKSLNENLTDAEFRRLVYLEYLAMFGGFER